MNHDEIAELLGAYALDAVDPDEATLVAVHVQDCPRCTAELDEHLAVAGMLGNVGGTAPAELWDRIASQATAPRSATRGDGALDVPEVLRARTPRGTDVAASRPRSHRRAPRWGAVALASAAAVTILLMGVQITHLNSKVDALAATSQLHGLTQAEQAALLDPSASRVTLDGPAGGGTMLVELVLVRSGPSFLVNSQLPSLPAGETYQLWSMHGTLAVSLGLLGAAPSVVPFTYADQRATTVFAITAEHSGGAVTPTSAPVAASKPQFR